MNTEVRKEPGLLVAAYWQGYYACRDVEEFVNPFDEGSDLQICWLAGWQRRKNREENKFKEPLEKSHTEVAGLVGQDG